MIKIKTMYELYNMYLQLKIQKIEEAQIKQKVLIENYLKELSKIRPFIEHYIDYNALLNGKVSELPVMYKDAIQSFAFNNIIVKNYHNLYTVLLKYENEIQEIKKQQIPFKVYKRVIHTFNHKMLRFCVKTGKNFEHKYFGNFQIGYTPDPTHIINWKASHEKKKEILARGGKIYNQEEADAAKEAGIPYHGEKYIVKKFDKGLLFWRWNTSGIYRDVLKRELYNYKFIPAKGNFGCISILREAYNDPNHDYSIY